MIEAGRADSRASEPSSVSLDDKIGFLSTPESWPGCNRYVTVVETHHAWLFMTDRYVHKMKKPFRAGGMNFSSLASRHHLCLQEYRLNRPLARYTYLGVVPLVLTDEGSLAVNKGGIVVEWLVRMRRLPESRALPVLAQENRLTNAHIAKLVLKLSQFHESASVCRSGPGEYVGKLRDRLGFWHRELVRCRLGWSEPPAGLVAAQLEYLDVHRGLLDSRAHENRVRSVHGDLRPEHIFFPEDQELQVIDCLEFDAELRELDIAAELAYFAMECRHAGFPRVAARCLADYHRRQPGCLGPAHLIDFYASVAATVRAGLMGWRSLEKPGSGEWCERARAYLGAARHYIEKAL